MLVEGLPYDYFYEPWSNGQSDLSPSSLQDPPLRGHGRVNWLAPNLRMVSVLYVVGPPQLTSLVVAGQLGD